MLQFHAGLGVRPAEVYLPTASAFAEQAPPWARGLHADVVASFEEIGVEVVQREHYEITHSTTHES